MAENPFAPPSEPAEALRATPLRLASPGARLAARLADQLFVLAAAIPGLLIGFLLVQVDLELGLGVGAFVGVIGAIAVTSYNWYLIPREGRTLGKRLLRIRIEDTDGRPPDFLHGVVLREWVLSLCDAFLSLFTGLGVIGIVDSLLVFSDGNRTLHDRLAGTVVLTDASDDETGESEAEQGDGWLDGL